MPYISKLIYKVPSFQEGIARVFDIPGRIKDDFTVARVQSKRPDVGVSGSTDPIEYGVKAINKASARIDREMTIAGNQKRTPARLKYPNSESK